MKTYYQIKIVITIGFILLGCSCNSYYNIQENEEVVYHFVNDKTSLIQALNSADKGDQVIIDNKAFINLSGLENIRIPGGITIRGKKKYHNKKPLLFSDSLKSFPLLITGGENIKISGVKLQGPDTLRRTLQMKSLLEKSKNEFYKIPNSRGIQIIHSNVEIENCEIYGWSHAGIYVNGNIEKININNNNIHHNQRYGLGYGVCLNKASAIIEHNFFDWNRHSIAGTGASGTSYIARYNIVGKNASSHAFDMHGGADRKDGTNIAGENIEIYNNKFLLDEYEAILIRGVPAKSAVIRNNEFAHYSIDKAVRQINGKGKVQIKNNKLGNKK